jgi:dihydrofolate synthase/folylpolyglutamate synthase
LAHILRSAGYRVGLYTSPHLYSFNERIRLLEPGNVAGASAVFEGVASMAELSDRARYYQDPVDHLRFKEGVGITWFEYVTVLAVSWFAHNQADIVVLETGLGGRLDATNALETMVCGIAPVGMEHTRLLGNTLAAIASEKAGIIKSASQQVVLAGQQPEALEVLRARCRAFGIVPTEVACGTDFPVRSVSLQGTVFDFRGRREYHGLSIRLPGEHQAVNAALAVAMAESLEFYGFVLSVPAVRQGLSEVFWPARFEVFSGTPMAILDCAHTGESAHALARTFMRVFPGRRCILVFGIGTDKDALAVARGLMPVVDRVVLTRAEHARATDPAELLSAGLFAQADVRLSAGVPEALSKAIELAGPDGLVLVSGSVFVCAEARALVPAYFRC